jgi:hypothetical protein
LRRGGATGLNDAGDGPRRVRFPAGGADRAGVPLDRMTDQHDQRKPALALTLRAKMVLLAARHYLRAMCRGTLRFSRRRWVRRTLWSVGGVLAVVVVAAAGLWWRLGQGPIELDLATPWLKAAIQENFGGNHKVTVGGTQLERDENGRTSLRLRDVVVRDADGTVVASAPKAEVGISGIGLLHGQVRAESLNLVGAHMAVRIEADGRVTVFAGADKRPIATAVPAQLTPNPKSSEKAIIPKGPLRSGLEGVSGVLAWIDRLGATGLDGHDLRELGLKDGNLTVDDRRNGKRWTFNRIDASLRRPKPGGIVFSLQSKNPQHHWRISAAMRPLADGTRAIGLEARRVSTRDILLALRAGNTGLEADLPLSASVRAEIATDGTPQVVQGQILLGAGTLVDRSGKEPVTVKLDRGDFRFNWDSHRNSLIVPLQVVAGGNQFTLSAVLKAPDGDSGVWQFGVTRGDSVIDPIILAPPVQGGESLAFNHVNIRGRIDTRRHRIDLVKGDLSRSDTRPLHNVGLAVTGSLDYSSADPYLAFGVAGTRMPMSALKRLWPVNVATGVRSWVEDHIFNGTVEHVVIAGNAPLSEYQYKGPPLREDGLSIDIETSGTTLRPVPKLPPIRDADLAVHVTGGTAAVNLGRGTVEVAPGRKLNIADGLFEVADTHHKPAKAQVHFRIDGSVPSVAMLLANETLSGLGLSLDPSTSRGTVAAQVALSLPLLDVLPKNALTYSVSADLSNFAADKLLMGRKIQAASLNVQANNAGYQVKGNVKLNGTPAAIRLNRQKNSPEADVQLQVKLDDAARRRLGINLGSGITGTIPVKLTGKVVDGAKDERMIVDADLTPAKIDELLPGWVKADGKSAHLTANMVKSGKSVRFEDLNITGSGVTVKGSIDVEDGEIASAHFPVFAISDGDKVTLRADRGRDGVLRVVMRGDVYDGRRFIKSALAGNAGDKGEKGKPKQPDLDLDLKIGAIAGHNGEVLRGVNLKLSRRGGTIRAFTLSAKIGRDASLIGDLRLRASDNHQVVYFETADAGALFRFTDMYPRMYGGHMWVAMDPPTADQKPQVGHLYIGDFTVRGEPTLDRIASGAKGKGGGSVSFTELHCDFTRTSGRMSVSDGVVRGPLMGATIEGNIDYVKDQVHLRGTFVPLYGINNMFGQIPIVGLFLGGGSNEGLLGITYEAVGPPSAPRVRVNPVSAIAPGLLRKFIPSPGAFDPRFVPPSR